MDLFKAITTRSSVREFTKEKIPEEHLLKILEAGSHAPSSKNSQPWFFLVDTTEKKNKIAEIIEKKHSPLFTPEDPRTGKPAKPSTAIESARALREAAAVILIFCQSPFTGGKKEVLKKPERRYLLSYSSEIESVAAAAQNMLLMAHALGLGAFWNCDTYYIEEDIKRLYDQEHDFQLAICLGHRAKESKVFPKVRLKKYKFVRSENNAGGEI